MTDTHENGGDLRAKLEAALEQVRELTAKQAETDKELNKYRAGDVWDELKVDKKYRAAYVGPTDKESIEAWWNNAKDLFGVTNAEGTGGSETSTTATTNVSPEERAALEKHQNLSGDGRGADPDVEASQQAALKDLIAKRRTDPNSSPGSAFDAKLAEYLGIPVD